MKSDDEDGIKKMLQRTGGCCEPVQVLKMPSPSELAAESLSRSCPVETVKIVEAAFILQQTRVAPRDYSRPS